MTHQEAVESLALSKGTNLYEVKLGSPYMAYFNNVTYPGIADVVVIKPSYTHFCVDIIEVKVNRADFMQDLNNGKYLKYFDHCHRFYFTAPKGVIHKQDIPISKGVGFIQYNPEKKSWTTIISAIKRDIEIPEETLLAMLFKRTSYINPVYRYVKYNRI